MPGRGPSSASAPPERRSDPRVAVDLAAEVSGRDWSGALAARTRDVSVGGACIATPSPIAIGAISAVCLRFPEEALSLRAVGTWQRVHPTLGIVLTGVRFESPPPAALDLLWDAVSRATNQVARFLLAQPALSEIGIDGAIGLAQSMRLCPVRGGDVIYPPPGRTSSPSSIYVVQEGSVALQLRAGGARYRDFAIAHCGELFGRLPPGDHSEFAIARSQARLLEIDERAFGYLASTSPRLAQCLFAALTTAYLGRMQRAIQALWSATPAA
jgi:hypothetical protein